MGQYIGREQKSVLGLALTAALGTTPEIGFEQFAGGTIFIPSGSPITSLTFYAAPFQATSQPPGTTQTYQPLYSQWNNSGTVTTGAAVVLTVAAGQCYPLPVECFGGGAVKIVVNAAGSVDLSFKG